MGCYRLQSGSAALQETGADPDLEIVEVLLGLPNRIGVGYLVPLSDLGSPNVSSRALDNGRGWRKVRSVKVCHVVPMSPVLAG